MYHVIETRGRKKYHYIVRNIRFQNKWKKISVYIGVGLNKAQIETGIKKHSKTLEEKVKNFIKANDSLFSILADNDIKQMEKIKNAYTQFSKKSATVREKYYEWFLTNFTYDTNAIEGSTVTLQETSTILFDKISPPGKTIREIKEVETHKNAFDYMINYKEDINKRFVLRLHKILTADILGKKESGKFRTVQVFIRGEEQLPPKASSVPEQFTKLIKWYNSGKKKYHPVVVASYFHIAFEGIHPFIDFNGRTGRLLMNFILLKNGFPAIDIRNREKLSYYTAIKSGINEDINPFAKLVMKYLKEFEKV